jgi:hypothetical protein
VEFLKCFCIKCNNLLLTEDQIILNDNRDECLKHYLYICYSRMINYDNSIILPESTKKDIDSSKKK